MADQSKHPAVITNTALQPFTWLIGEWQTVGTHPLVPDTTFHGHSSFQWLENGAFIIWRSTIDSKDIPAGIAIFGSDNMIGEYYMLYFDERDISRKYTLSIQPEAGVLQWWRYTSEFSQRQTWTFVEEEGDQNRVNTIVGKGEMSKDGGTSWEEDLNLTFTRIK